MLRHETILGLLDLSQMRGVKPACAKFALKGAPKEKQSWAIMPGDERADSRLPMRAPAFYRERSHSPGKRFLSNRSLTTTNRAGGEKAEHTLEETGKIFGVTRERIRQIESAALKKLRHPRRGLANPFGWDKRTKDINGFLTKEET